jgi:hypothetical protein
MHWFEWLLLGIVMILIFLPPKYDPAIWWKERNERKRDK